MLLAPQQDQAANAVTAWLKDRSAKQFFYLAGFAGTGKTTIARVLAQNTKRVVFAAFTGKAALVLQSKGCSGASTIHSLIYKLDDAESAIPTFSLNPDSPVADADLVIIDEVSMVGEELGRDLLSFGTRVLVLGDPAQLPPISGEGFFTAGDPDFMLTEVHRQAADNPIIRLSMLVREGQRLERGKYGESRIISRDQLRTDDVVDADQVLVGKNMTRRKYNGRLRELNGFSEPHFMIGDRVICLKNNKEKGLLNGGIWSVEKLNFQDLSTTIMQVSPLDSGMVQAHALVETHHAWLRGEEKNLHWQEARKYDPFDFAYAITVHKAQGSQWDDVIIFDESATFREDRQKHLYTAITRAAEKVTVVL